MKYHPNLFKNQRGYLSIVSVVLIIVVGFIAAALTYATFGSAKATLNAELSTAALYLAESGLEEGTHTLIAFDLANRAACSGLNLNLSLGDGVTSVVSTGPFYVSAPTTLNGALTASATTIPVLSTANYQSSGRIVIDKESMNYAAKDGSNFLFVQRGVDGTIAATHVTTTPVAQYQCNLVATGGVPALTVSNPGDASGLRILNQTVQLQEGWAVANGSGSTYNMMRWNRPTELSWTNSLLAGLNRDLRGVSMISNVDGWAVGESGTFLRWNGSSWSAVSVTVPSTLYNGVFCNSRNDCHAVGNTSGGSVLVRWTGSSWARITPGGVSDSFNLNSVHCSASNDCWAVGARNTGTFYYWNGLTWTGIAATALSGYPFDSVFCNSSTDCWAVGANATFARKSGASWANFATGLPSAQYNGIFCNSSSDCWAVGNVNSGNNLLVRWNGSSWNRDTSNPTPTANLNTVACTGRNDCWAAGNTTGGQPLFLHWDGTDWTRITTSGLANQAVNSISLVGPDSQPWGIWSQSFA